MKNLRFILNVVLVLLLVVAFSSVASAQATRTWVSGVGDDVNPCSRTAPCKTFAGAISKTADNGEIDCLDGGGFGTLTITKSITIDCDGGESGGILASGVPGITVSIASSTTGAIVVLRNLNINGTGTTNGTTGINVTAAQKIALENVLVQTFNNSCLNVNNSSGAVAVFADNSKFINCNISNTANIGAVTVGQNAKGTITRSLIAQSPGPGIATASTGAQVLVTGSTIANTSFALQSNTGNFMGASGNTFTNNGGIYNQNGGQIFTGSDNPSFGNGPTGPTSGAVPKN